MTDREALRAAMAYANLPTLVVVLYQLSGDRRWLGDRYRPGPRHGWDPNDSGGYPADVQAEIRTAAIDAIVRWQAGKPPAVERPAPDLLVQLMSLLASEEVPPDYGAMYAAQFGFAETDLPKPPTDAAAGFETAIIGAGFGGIFAAIRLKQAGVPFTIFERNDRAGGVWAENDYPACGVDTPSFLYVSSFLPRNWSRFFAKRDEILEYVDQLIDTYDLRPNIRFRTRVVEARFDNEISGWDVDVVGADSRIETHSVRALISAVGIFGQPRTPDIAGMDSFEGAMFHSTAWPADLDIAGKRVALVGTGASSMQILPAIVDRCKSVTVCQRSPGWIMPVSNYFHDVPEAVKLLNDTVPFYRAWYRFALAWTFNDRLHTSLQVDPDWHDPDRSLNARNDGFRHRLTRYIESELEGRPDLLAKCIPDYPVWGKRMLIDNGWYAALKRDHVELIAESVARITPAGIVTTSGKARDADVIVLATGFETTRYLHPIRIVGRDGKALSDAWNDDDPRALLGIATAGFPNLFLLYGPNTNGAGGSILTVLESQADYVVKLLVKMIEGGIATAEPRADVQEAYNASIDAEHARMIWQHPRVTSYIKNSRGRVVNQTPFRIIDYWSSIAEPDLEHFVLDQKSAGASR